MLSVVYSVRCRRKTFESIDDKLDKEGGRVELFSHCLDIGTGSTTDLKRHSSIQKDHFEMIAQTVSQQLV